VLGPAAVLEEAEIRALLATRSPGSYFTAGDTNPRRGPLTQLIAEVRASMSADDVLPSAAAADQAVTGLPQAGLLHLAQMRALIRGFCCSPKPQARDGPSFAQDWTKS
jgi:hypothetical protein